MNNSITYEDALLKHPEQVADIIQQMRKSRIKNKNTEPSTWNWSYTWCQEVECCDIEEMLSSMFSGERERKERERKALPLEERITRELSKCRVSLSGHSRSSPVSTEVLRDEYRKMLIEQISEEERDSNMSPEECQTALDESLRELSKSPGFFAVRM